MPLRGLRLDLRGCPEIEVTGHRQWRNESPPLAREIGLQEEDEPRSEVDRLMGQGAGDPRFFS